MSLRAVLIKSFHEHVSALVLAPAQYPVASRHGVPVWDPGMGSRCGVAVGVPTQSEMPR